MKHLETREWHTICDDRFSLCQSAPNYLILLGVPGAKGEGGRVSCVVFPKYAQGLSNPTSLFKGLHSEFQGLVGEDGTMICILFDLLDQGGTNNKERKTRGGKEARKEEIVIPFLFFFFNFLHCYYRLVTAPLIFSLLSSFFSSHMLLSLVSSRLFLKKKRGEDHWDLYLAGLAGRVFTLPYHIIVIS